MLSNMPQGTASTIHRKSSISSLRPLCKEITAVLLIKLMLLAGIWYLFFSEPVDEHLSASDVSEYILNKQ